MTSEANNWKNYNTRQPIFEVTHAVYWLLVIPAHEHIACYVLCTLKKIKEG